MVERLGRYRIVRKIGEGGMGEVYLAEDTLLPRPVAIKALREKTVGNPNALRRFRQEAQLISSLNHPNIVVVYEIGESDGLHYIATEFVEGETLRDKLAHRLDLAHILQVTIQVATALEAAHRKGIVHRDIKPENIMVRTDGYVKVLDFGIATLSGPQEMTEETRTIEMTKPGVAVGTASYMSPEQAQGKRVDHRSDVFSLGSTLYEMVTGKPPFSAPSYAETMVNILTRDPQPMGAVAPDVPAELDEIVRKSLAKKVDDRYSSAAGMAEDLKLLYEDVSFQSRVGRRRLATADQGAAASIANPAQIQAPRENRRFKGMWAAAAASVLAVAVGTYLWTKPVATAATTIAVMPFVNVGGNSANAYLSEGLTDTLIGTLSQFPGVRVSARSTIAAFASRNLTPEDVRKQLQVQTQLFGRVSRNPDSVSVSVEMVDTSDGSIKWSKTYERHPSDLYAVERDLAEQIAEQLKVELGASGKAALTGQSDRAGAYDAYLKGRYQLATVSLEGRRRALELFRQAADLDQHYAAAYAGLAETYITLGYSAAPDDMIPLGREAARKAISLDPKLAEPHAMLAQVAERFDRNWAEAEKEYRAAIQLNPQNALILTRYALYCMRMLRWDDAIANGKKAVEMEPHSFSAATNLGWIYYHHRQFDPAIEEFKRALAIDPGAAWGHHLLSGAYAQKGLFKEAIEEGKTAIEHSDDTTHRAGLAVVYAESGDEQGARRELKLLIEKSKKAYVVPYFPAWVSASLGDANAAFEYLHRSIAEHDQNAAYVRIEPAFDKLHADPRYAEYLASLGLPQ